jgi:hypothetical protein
MSQVEAQPAERRRHRRVEVPAVAAVSSGARFVGVFAVANLSLGGASLVGEALLMPGERIRLTMQLPGRRSLSLAGRLLRRQVSSPKGRRCAIVFEDPTAADTAALASALAAESEIAPPANVLLVWGRPSGGNLLLRELAGAGHEALLAPTPLEAAACLRRRGQRIGLVLVEYGLLRSMEWDFLQYLTDHHGRAKRIVIVDGAESFRLNFMLRAGLAEAVLERPFSAAALARRLGPGPLGVQKRPRKNKSTETP